MTFGSLRKSIRRLYGGATPRGIRFRYALLAFDIATVLFIIATSFLPSFAERADARFAPSVAAARDDTTAIKQSCDLSVGYDTRQLASARRGRRHRDQRQTFGYRFLQNSFELRAGWFGRRLWQR